MSGFQFRPQFEIEGGETTETAETTTRTKPYSLHD
jgi:hypothetical protein